MEEAKIIINEADTGSDSELRHKMIIGLAAVIVLPLISGIFLYLSHNYNSLRDTQKRMETKIENVLDMTGSLLKEAEDFKTIYEDHLRISADMQVAQLRMQINEQGVYEGEDVLEDGIIVHTNGSTITYPDGYSASSIPLPEGFPQAYTDVYTTEISIDVSSTNATVVIREICKDTYYLEWTLTDEENEYLAAHFDLNRQLGMIEEVSDGELILVDRNNQPVYNPFDYSDAFIRNGFAAVETDIDTNADGNLQYFCRTYEDYGVKALLVMRKENTVKEVNRLIIFSSFFMGMILLGLYVWTLTSQKMVKQNILTEAQKNRYRPSRMKKMASIAGVLCALLVFFGALFLDTMSGLYRQSEETSLILKEFASIHQKMETQKENVAKEEQDWYLYYAERAAGIIADKEEQQIHDLLVSWAADLDAAYMMLFDAKGNEITAGNDYVHFTLGMEEGDWLYELRRLTKGVDSLVLDPGIDEVTGQEVQVFGAKVRMENQDGFGVLVIAMDPAKITKNITNSLVNQAMHASVPADTGFFALEPETGKVIYASEEAYTGRIVMDSGLLDSENPDSAMRFFSFYGMTMYGASKMIDGLYCCCGIHTQSLFGNSLPFAGGILFVFVISWLLLSVLMFAGFDQKFFDRYASIGTEVVRGLDVEIITEDGRIRKSRDPSKRWSISLQSWKDLLPEQKTRVVLNVMLGLLLAYGLNELRSYNSSAESLFAYLLSNQWDKGINLFAAANTLLVFSIAYLGLLCLRLILHMICSAVDLKGETILRLIYNLLQYLIIFTVLFVAFHNFGIDTSALLATMGLVTLALSIGSRDLVTDIIAGITIVFEGEFQVGDIIEIDGYRGKVEEIGVRSTKLIGMGDNVKIISNRDIRNVLNTSRFNSWYAMQLNISSACNIDKLEEMLKKELPEMKNRISNLIGGPYYRGVESIGKDSFRITILAECKEEDYRWIQRQLNREIRLLFDREGIQIL